jgi:glyoxylase-like metal-dependent hydrolase (beta-lactamase superfamily II)
MNKLTVLTIEQIYNNNIKEYHPVILKSDTEMVLVDCGTPGSVSKIKENALTKDVNIDDLTKVVITHQDLDHIGSLAELKRKYPGVQILADIKERPYINGEKEFVKLQKLRETYDSLSECQKEMITALQQSYSSYEPVEIDGILHDHDIFSWCGSVEIVSTPGHTEGHICLYLYEFKTLIAGDALFVQNGELVISMPMYTLDFEQAKQSVRKLLDYDIKEIICYHGGIYKGDIKAALNKILMH